MFEEVGEVWMEKEKVWKGGGAVEEGCAMASVFADAEKLEGLEKVQHVQIRSNETVHAVEQKADSSNMEII